MGDKTKFIEAYNELKRKDQKPAREEIIELNGWKSPAHFYMKAGGTRQLLPDEAVVVRKVLKKYGVNWSQ